MAETSSCGSRSYALAFWIEEEGAKGLLKMMQDHALATIDLGRDDAYPMPTRRFWGSSQKLCGEATV